MKNHITIIILVLFAKASFGQNTVSASISFPRNSGLFLVDYTTFTIDGDSLFVIYKKFGFHPRYTKSFTEGDSAFDYEIKYKHDTFARYEVSQEYQAELAQLIAETDSFGHHYPVSCQIELGWPRFYISAVAGEKHLEGFISNCYREHIYRFVDLFNEVYPEDKVFDYNKEELIEIEESFNKKAAKKEKK